MIWAVAGLSVPSPPPIKFNPLRAFHCYPYRTPKPNKVLYLNLFTVRNMKTEITNLNQLDLGAIYSYSDYLSWRFEELVELIKGRVSKMSPAPSIFHQTVSANILTILKIATKGHSCKVFAAPTDVRLFTKDGQGTELVTVVQPDIFVICDATKLDEKGCMGSPDLIVEIISPSTASKDITIKYELYQETGVGEYWLVFPNEMIVQIFVLQDGVYQRKGVYSEDAQIPVHTLPGLLVKVEEIFER